MNTVAAVYTVLRHTVGRAVTVHTHAHARARTRANVHSLTVHSLTVQREIFLGVKFRHSPHSSFYTQLTSPPFFSSTCDILASRRSYVYGYIGRAVLEGSVGE